MKITIEVEGFKHSIEMPDGTTFNDFMECNMDLVSNIYTNELVNEWIKE